MTSVTRWSIRSNNGWREISFDAQSFDRGARIVDFAIGLTGESLDQEGGRRSDFHIQLPHLRVPQTACIELVKKLTNWSQLRGPFSCVLAAGPEQECEIFIGQRENLIVSQDKPALTMRYHTSGCSLEVFFVVDQSCIAEAIMQLDRTLAQFER